MTDFHEVKKKINLPGAFFTTSGVCGGVRSRYPPEGPPTLHPTPQWYCHRVAAHSCRASWKALGKLQVRNGASPSALCVLEQFSPVFI